MGARNALVYLVASAFLCAPVAAADPGGPAGVGQGGIGGEPGIAGGPNLSPVASSALFLCPGDGNAWNVLGGGGGYCDFDFQEVKLAGPPGIGTMHVHCEFMGFAPIAAHWQCWRVFPGQPDHMVGGPPPDPDVIPDGWGVPWAITGPRPDDQWPPPGLAPAPPPEPPGAPPPEPPPPAP